MNLSEAANRVIAIARKIPEYYETELRKRYPNYPLVDEDADNLPPPPEEKELADFLATLSDDLIYQLLLLVEVNRKRFPPSDLAEHYEALKKESGERKYAESELLIYKDSLADELTEGLEELRQHQVNVDKIPLKKVKVRKR